MENNLLKNSVKALLEKKGENIKILDLRKFKTFADFFIIVSGTSNRHNQTLADIVKEDNKIQGFGGCIGEEGYNDGKWILIDYGDIIIHIFDEESRNFYDIEGFWRDADTISVESLKIES